jgi:NADH-quinone oxidoreductase subunit J
VLFLFAQLATLITSASGQVPGPSTRVDNAAISPEWGGLEAVGRVLLSDYMLPFEIASVLLLVAMIGALLIARKKA